MLRRFWIVGWFMLACSGEPATSPSATSSGAAGDATEPERAAKFDPASITAPRWIDPPAPERTREPGTGNTRELDELYAAMVAVEGCPIAHGWFAPCAAAEQLIERLEPVGNGLPGASPRFSSFAAAHIDDPTAPVRLIASWWLANQPASVDGAKVGPANWQRLIEALERESDANVVSLQLRQLALADALDPSLADRVAAVARAAVAHPDIGVREAAIEALTHPDVRTRPGVVDPLLRVAALDADVRVRAHACARLGLFADDRVGPWLLERTRSIDDVDAAACLEAALELAARGPVASSETGAALLDRVAAAGSVHTHARTLRLLARAAAREHGQGSFDRQRLVATLADELSDGSNDMRTREAAAFAATTLGVGRELRASVQAQRRSIDALSERLLARCELLAAAAPPSEAGWSVANTKLRRPEPALVGFIDLDTLPLDGDLGLLWDAAVDSHHIVLTSRSSLREQQINVDYHHARTTLFPPSMIALIAEAAATGTALPEIRFPAVDDHDGWAESSARKHAFDVLAEHYTMVWPFLSDVTTATRHGHAQRENLLELAEHYEALRSAATQGRDAVLATGVERILASDHGFFGERRAGVALIANVRTKIGGCWQEWTHPCEVLSDPSLPEQISGQILRARLDRGDIGVAVYNLANRRVRAELVELLRGLAPRGAGEHTRIWVEITGPFLYAGGWGNPLPWIDALRTELESAGVDSQRIRLFVELGDRRPASVTEQLERLDVWYR